MVTIKQALEAKRLPTFFIIGAMKCGTSTLHQILARHPGIFIPEGEVRFFCVDDLEAFPPGQWDGNWVTQNFEGDFDRYLEWYVNFYREAAPDTLLGEDTAAYLSSPKAISRMAKYRPEAKLSVLLRDPVARTYSQYWHWVVSGRAVASFEDSLRLSHGNLLQRSYYEEQLRHCLDHFPSEQVKVILFEELIGQPRRVVNEVLEFLAVEPCDSLDVARHENRGHFPKRLRMKLWENYLFTSSYGRGYSGQFPGLRPRDPEPVRRRWLRRLFRRLNPSLGKNPHQINAATRGWLSDYLRRRNAGLPALLQRDLTAQWPSFREDA